MSSHREDEGFHLSRDELNTIASVLHMALFLVSPGEFETVSGRSRAEALAVLKRLNAYLDQTDPRDDPELKRSIAWLRNRGRTDED